MILPFSTQLNGKPTYFVEKIIRTILNEYAGKVEGIADFIYSSGEALHYENIDDIFHKIEHQVKPKLHTIRGDKNDRWKAGKQIHFYINNRSKNAFQFAPIIPVVSIQKIEIERHNNTGIWDKDFTVCVDEHYLNRLQIRCLTENDGFDTIEDFFAYFNEDFTGKIIHWTDKRY